MDILALVLWLIIIFSGLLVIANIIILWRSFLKDRDLCEIDLQIEQLRKQVSTLRNELDALKLKIRALRNELDALKLENRKNKGEKDDYEIL